ncbi:response regulator [Alishewanella sp. SMS8]|uniref:response regulator n=1 Tax=Alishewanella sp. SMS8 TaxID=2994676 RepID=UPI00274208B0|nr:response regulator [Alishewanella sp. SMS8]MDP5460392.1 response regulator [Alishewanella sp. SMS8]
MNTSTKKNQYCSTTQAAKLLGISVGTVQQLVENGTLQAWKTAGGHRRILLTSVETLLYTKDTETQVNTIPNQKPLSLYIVEDDPLLLKSYQKLIEKTQLPVICEPFDNGLDAMLKIGSNFPDVLFLDLEVPFIDGFEMLKRLQKISVNKSKHILVITGLTDSEILVSNAQQHNITLLKKPVNPAFIEGYLQAICMERRR